MSTKALIGILLAGTAGVIIFLFVHLSQDGGTILATSTTAAVPLRNVMLLRRRYGVEPLA